MTIVWENVVIAVIPLIVIGLVVRAVFKKQK